MMVLVRVLDALESLVDCSRRERGEVQLRVGDISHMNDNSTTPTAAKGQAAVALVREVLNTVGVDGVFVVPTAA